MKWDTTRSIVSATKIQKKTYSNARQVNTNESVDISQGFFYCKVSALLWRQVITLSLVNLRAGSRVDLKKKHHSRLLDLPTSYCKASGFGTFFCPDIWQHAFVGMTDRIWLVLIRDSLFTSWLADLDLHRLRNIVNTAILIMTVYIFLHYFTLISNHIISIHIIYSYHVCMTSRLWSLIVCVCCPLCLAHAKWPASPRCFKK